MMNVCTIFDLQILFPEKFTEEMSSDDDFSSISKKNCHLEIGVLSYGSDACSIRKDILSVWSITMLYLLFH